MAANLNIIDSDDEEFWQILDAYVDLEMTRRPRTIRDRSNPLSDYDDIEFRMRFRLPKVAILALLARIEDSLVYSSVRYGQISPMNQLLIALRFLASGSFQVHVTVSDNYVFSSEIRHRYRPNLQGTI